MSEERDTKTIAGMFAEALGCLEDALCYLEQVNAEYDAEEHSKAFGQHGLPPCDPVWKFWGQTDQAEEALNAILYGLELVKQHAPKEVTA